MWKMRQRAFKRPVQITQPEVKCWAGTQTQGSQHSKPSPFPLGGIYNVGVGEGNLKQKLMLRLFYPQQPT